MAITSLADYVAAFKQRRAMFKGNNVNTPGCISDGWTQANNEDGGAAGAAAPGNTTAGLVPTNATTGAMRIDPFSGSGYITWVDLTCGLGTSQVTLYDRLWHGGAFLDNHGSTYTLSAQPSYSSRVPGGTDYTGLQIWGETSTGFNNSTCTLTVTYTDQSGNTGHTTGAVTFANPGTNVLGNLFLLPLAAGDCGVQKIESVTFSSGATNGSGVNVLVVRPLWRGIIADTPVPCARAFGIDQTGMPQVWQDSALNLMVKTAAAVFATAYAVVEIAAL
jgi:hypothetical protein